MSSISLPRVLQPKKANSLDLERETFEKSQAISISKAINNHENPLKEKHVRSAIIGTFQEKGATTFWTIVNKLPLQGNPIVCWKFCHTVHKVLREGHPNSIPESFKFKNEIVGLGKLWGHLKEGYGKLIACYTKLLVVKLDFHKRNPRFPGNMQLTAGQLDDIGERDVNNYFQITVEMFDYMDEILNLQAAIFGSLDMSRSNSMTSTGQCRLAPLIPCIQDSSQLYDYSVKLLFKLHSNRASRFHRKGLSPDTLVGHSDRFRKQFYLLRQFYLSSSTLQYFKHLIQIPLLPDDPPDFLVETDLSCHLSPVVILPPQADTPDNDSVSDIVLVDTSSPDLLASGEPFQRNGSVSPEQTDKDRWIEQLLQEIEDLKLEIQRISIESQRATDDLKRHIRVLESQIAELQLQLSIKIDELDEIKKKANDETVQQSDMLLKQAEAEKKSKACEEKFLKMKDVYNKLREEHITLIRTKAEVEKQHTNTLKTHEEILHKNTELEAALRRASEEKATAQEVLQKSASDTSQQLATVLSTKDALEKLKQDLEDRLQMTLGEKASLDDQIEKLLAEKLRLDAQLAEALAEGDKKQQAVLESCKSNEFQLLGSWCDEAVTIIRSALDDFDNPSFASVKCAPEYLLTQINPLMTSLNNFKIGFEQFESVGALNSLIGAIGTFSHHLAQCILTGKATSFACLDFDQGEKLSQICTTSGEKSIALLEKLKVKTYHTDIPGQLDDVQSVVREMQSLGEQLITNMSQKEDISDMVEDELQSMDKAIEEAARRFQDLIAKSRAEVQGIKLEVNSKIIDACTGLMEAIRLLVQRSKSLQEEIVSQGRGTASAKEFYKRNHQWTEGLLSAAKAVGLGAKFLVDAADKVLSGKAKFEVLMVASQEIAASTAQLVVASKVKANRGSENLSLLSQASRGVSEATGNVVATAKSCAQMLDDSDVMDFSKLSLHQAKRLEMDSQVRVLELESQLTQERVKLSGLRKQHYMLAGPSEGWEEEDIPK